MVPTRGPSCEQASSERLLTVPSPGPSSICRHNTLSVITKSVWTAHISRTPGPACSLPADVRIALEFMGAAWVSSLTCASEIRRLRERCHTFDGEEGVSVVKAFTS